MWWRSDRIRNQRRLPPALLPRRGQRRPGVEPLEARELLATLPAGFVEAPVATGLSAPTAMEFAPNGDLWVLEQGGAVKRFRSGSTTADIVGSVASLGLDSQGERGLLGIAFDPQYASNKQVFLYYTTTTNGLHNRLSRFTVNATDATDYLFAGTSTAETDAGSSGTPDEAVIFNLNPLSASNHNGGAIHFGPDGKLYAAAGDNAVGSNSQTLGNLLGKILRINSDGTIPSDNPFFSDASGDNRAIWALGLRNPFTFAFQPGTSLMFINDVGQNAWEEINFGLPGSNYGWPGIEGPDGTPPTSPGTYREPLYTYSHGTGSKQGFAITGGAFYNPAVNQFGSQYVGDYFFADFVSSWIHYVDSATPTVQEFATGAGNPVDLRVGSDGSLYYLSRGAGQALRVSFAANPFPWHNSIRATDVDNNQETAPLDALLVINYLNAGFDTNLPALPSGSTPQNFYDVDPNNVVEPLDALLVINHLNVLAASSTGVAPGDSAAGESSADAAWLVGDWGAELLNRRKPR